MSDGKAEREKTLTELKAEAYDAIRSIQRLQSFLAHVNGLIAAKELGGGDTGHRPESGIVGIS
jgi:hypothetical protein